MVLASLVLSLIPPRLNPVCRRDGGNLPRKGEGAEIGCFACYSCFTVRFSRWAVTNMHL